MRIQKSAQFDTFEDAAAAYRKLLADPNIVTLNLTCSKLDEGRELYALSWGAEEEL